MCIRTDHLQNRQPLEDGKLTQSLANHTRVMMPYSFSLYLTHSTSSPSGNDAPVTVTILDCTAVQRKENDPDSIVRFYNCEVRPRRMSLSWVRQVLFG